MELLSGKEVDKELILAELTNLNEMLDQSEHERETLNSYYKKQVESLTKQLQTANNLATNTANLIAQSSIDPNSMYGLVFKQFQNEKDQNGEQRALEKLNDELFVRVFKDID